MMDFELFKTAMKKKLNAAIRTARRYAEVTVSCARAALSVASLLDPSGLTARLACLFDVPLSIKDMYDRYHPEKSSAPSARIDFDECDWVHEGDGTFTLRIPNRWGSQHSFSVYRDRGDEEVEVMVCSGYDRRGNIILHAKRAGFKGCVLRGRSSVSDTIIY